MVLMGTYDEKIPQFWIRRNLTDQTLPMRLKMMQTSIENLRLYNHGYKNQPKTEKSTHEYFSKNVCLFKHQDLC